MRHVDWIDAVGSVPAEIGGEAMSEEEERSRLFPRKVIVWLILLLILIPIIILFARLV